MVVNMNIMLENHRAKVLSSAQQWLRIGFEQNSRKMLPLGFAISTEWQSRECRPNRVIPKI